MTIIGHIIPKHIFGHIPSFNEQSQTVMIQKAIPSILIVPRKMCCFERKCEKDLLWEKSILADCTDSLSFTSEKENSFFSSIQARNFNENVNKGIITNQGFPSYLILCKRKGGITNSVQGTGLAKPLTYFHFLILIYADTILITRTNLRYFRHYFDHQNHFHFPIYILPGLAKPPTYTSPDTSLHRDSYSLAWSTERWVLHFLAFLDLSNCS